jgi:hypothetical protein
MPVIGCSQRPEVGFQGGIMCVLARALNDRATDLIACDVQT